jgi:hypothetical protein
LDITIEQLNLIMEQKVRTVLEKSSKEILQLFKEKYMTYVYDQHGENAEYSNPNGKEFENSWEWKTIEKKSNELITEMWSNPALMSHNANAFSWVGIHGSSFGSPDDVREFMPAILDKNMSSSLPVSVYRPTRFWNKFVEDYVRGDGLKKIIDKHCINEGLVPDRISLSAGYQTDY